MKRVLLITAALLTPVAAFAASPFDGTWKVAPSQSMLSKKPYVHLLADGVYHCYSCVPVMTVDADGKDHPIPNDPDVDVANVRVVDAHRVEKTFFKAGEKVSTSTFTISADGKTGVGEFTGFVGVGSAGPITTKFEYVRVKAGPKGAHAYSGSWRQTRVLDASEAGMLVTYRLEGNVLNMTTPTGQSFSAPVDGSEVKYVGDPSTDTVVVKRINARTFEETDKRAGKATAVERVTVSRDGKSLTAKYHDLVHDRDGQDVFIRQ